MAMYRILEQPTGLINGYPWPEVGETIELPDVVGDVMPGLSCVIRNDDSAVETRPAVDSEVETR